MKKIMVRESLNEMDVDYNKRDIIHELSTILVQFAEEGTSLEEMQSIISYELSHIDWVEN